MKAVRTRGHEDFVNGRVCMWLRMTMAMANYGIVMCVWGLTQDGLFATADLVRVPVKNYEFWGRRTNVEG
jgi:hypothetical protein